MKFKRLFIIAFTFLFVSLFAVSLNVGAATVETSDLIKVEGAQIRTSGNAGIRFVASEAYEGEAETAYGVILAFGEAKANDAFVLDGTVNGKEVVKGEVNTTYQGEFYVTLYNIPESFYLQKVSARAYVVDGDKVVYSENVAVKSLAEVALLAKNAGEDSELVNAAVAATEGYKKVYTDSYGRVFATSATYESDYQKLAELFIADWNEAFDTELDVTAFLASGANSKKWYTSAKTSTQTDWTGSKLKEFFQGETTGAKWSWLLEMLSAFSTNSFAKAQINAILTNTEDTANWYYGAHLCSDIMSVFAGSVQSSGFGGYQVQTPEKIATLTKFADYNKAIYANLAGAELVKLGEIVVLPAVTPATGYTANYDLDGTDYEMGAEYVVNSDVVFVLEQPATVYTVKFLFEGEEISDLEIRYTVEEEHEFLPFELWGFAFDGWYDNEEFDGEPVTKISKGTTGDKVYYAKMTEGETVSVEFDYMDNYTVEEIIADFTTDVYAYSTVESYEGKFLSEDKANGHYNNDYMPLNSAITNSNGEFCAKWGWLFKAISEVQANVSSSYVSKVAGLANEVANAEGIYIFCQELHGMLRNKQASKYWSAVMYDWSVDAANEKANVLAASKSDNVSQYLVVGSELETPTSVRYGYKFVGWYDNAEYTGEAIKNVPAADVTLYAKWEKVAAAE